MVSKKQPTNAIMKTSLLIVLSFLALPGFARDDASSDEAWLRLGFSKQLGKFKSTTLVPHPGESGIVAASCETDPSWWGSVYVLHHTADQVNWVATFPKEYRQNHGHYILSCQWRRLEHLGLWVLEIFDSTHMGNGSLWLFSLEGPDLRLLLHATARGRYLEPPADLKVPPLAETRLIEEHLHADYHPTVNGTANAEAVHLTGTIAVLDQEDKELSRAPFTEVWTWDAGKRVFIQTRP